MNKTPYNILGVSKTATDAEIKRAYHKLVMQYHPDKNAGDKAAEERFKEINNAFDILKDPQKRAAYDRFGDAAFAGGNGASAGRGGFNGNPFGNGNFEFHFGGDSADLNEMMDRMFKNMSGGFGQSPFGADAGGAGGRRTARQEFRGRDMLHSVVITLRDAFFGKTEKIKFTTNVKCEKCAGFGTADAKPAPSCERCRGTGFVRTRGGIFAMESNCPDCQGTGRAIRKPCRQCDGAGVASATRELDVKIPAGVMDGTRLQLRGQGEAGPLGGQSGDFYIDVRVKPDGRFERVGDNLGMNARVPFATLALGGEIEIETIDDKTMSVKISAGTQVGDRIRLRGMGMPSAFAKAMADKSASSSLRRGDLYIDITTEVPKKLTEKQRAALADFIDADTGKKKAKGWF